MLNPTENVKDESK